MKELKIVQARRGFPDRPTDCWIWDGAVDCRHGYGMVRTETGTTAFVHRISYETHVGPLLEKHHIDHMCHVVSCYNPAHLRQVTPRGNYQNRGGLNKNNTSGWRGVYQHKQTGKWIAETKINRVKVYIGSYNCPGKAGLSALSKRNTLGFLD